MSLITQFRGDVKSGKTASAVFWAKRLSGDIGVPVFSNMRSLAYHGMPWANYVSLDDVLVDIRVKELDQATIKLGVLLIDEAHVYWDGNLMRGPRGRALIAMIAQAGKRGLVIVYTSHLTGMVAPKVRELTQLQVKCKTPNEGKTIYWNIRNPREWRDAYDEGREPPSDSWRVLHEAYKQFQWYDTNEIIDPFEGEYGAGASKTSKKFMQELDAIAAGRDEARPVSASKRLEIDEAARIADAKARQEMESPRYKVFGGAR